MNLERFGTIAGRYPSLRVCVVGDFFLDRYLIIDPSKQETSIETGLPAHNVVEVQAVPGAAGTIANNLAALRVGEIVPVGFRGDDGEGYELHKALAALPGLNLERFFISRSRRTPVYCKPIVIDEDRTPRELGRLDFKNWTPTPIELQREIARAVVETARRVDAIILMDQVEVPESGVVTRLVRDAAFSALRERPELTILADSRQGLKDFPPFVFKMNAAELARLTGENAYDLSDVQRSASALAARNGRPVFVTLAERGIVAARPDRTTAHVPAQPVQGPIDIVGAGDAVSANLAVALAAGADLTEALRIATAAAAIVIRQLGTTGTASVAEIAASLGFQPKSPPS